MSTEKILNFNTEAIHFIRGFFLLILAISGNFIGETLSCKSQTLFSNNMVVKQAIIFSMIFFTLNFTSESTPSPKTTFKKSTMMWVMFLFFTKLPPIYTFLTFVTIFVVYVTEKQLEYNTKIEKKDNENLLNIQYYSIRSILPIILVGFITYYFEKRQEYGKSFKNMTFIFGKQTCNGMR